MLRWYGVASRKRKCHKCGTKVPKGTPIELMRYKRWPNSRWWSEDATCVGCIMKEFETVAPDMWKTIAIEKIVDTEGMVDVA